MGMLFLKKNLRETTRERVIWEKASPKRRWKYVFFPNIPCRPSDWASFSENTLADPLIGRLILKTALADPLIGRQILKTALADPLIGRLILKTTLADPLIGHLFRRTSLADPLIGHLFRRTSLADPPIGHLFRKTSLADGSEAGFSRETTKTIPAFRLRFIPARHAIKSRLPGNAFHNSLPLYRRPIGV